MEYYERVSLIITKFDAEDVITTSGITNNTNGVPQERVGQSVVYGIGEVTGGENWMPWLF